MSIKDKLRVLVVDDTSTSRGLLLQALDGLGIGNVASAPDGEAALRSLNAKPVHLVISDYHMPKMDGLALLQRMRSQATTAKTGFILVSGRADEQVLAVGRKLRMNNVVTKPFTPAQLRGAIEAVVGRL